MTVVESLVPIGRPITALRLDLEWTIYTFLGNNLTTRTERLRKVTDEAGRSLAFVHDYDEVVIQLAESAAPERPIKLKFEIDGDFLVSPAGDSYWELGISDWFPQPSLAGQFYTFHATVRVKKPFVPFAPGKTVRRTTDGDENLLETRVDKPICFAVILAGRLHDPGGGQERRHDPRRHLRARQPAGRQAAHEPRGHHHPVLPGVPRPVSASGVQHHRDQRRRLGPGAARDDVHHEGGLQPDHDGRTCGQGGSRGVNELIRPRDRAPVLGDRVVKMPSLEEQWLTESFAEYCAALFMKAYKNEAAYKAIVSDTGAGARRSAERRDPDSARQRRLRLEGPRDALLHSQRAALQQGAGAPVRAPQGARRRGLLHVPEVVPEVVRLEVRAPRRWSRACSST